LHIHLVALLFTAFAIAGLCSAINMIDGKNGLASGSVAISLLGVHVIASQGGAVDLAQTALVVTWIIAGFIFLNWPLGRLFMGDGGAYLIGFSLALCIIDLADSGISSPWASLLIVMYPVSEVLFTVARRLRGGNPIDQPDQNHLHHLVERALISRWFGRLGKTSKNSLVAPIILPAHAACVAIAALWPTDALILFGACIAALAAMACGLTSLRDILQKACDC
jgi:UDP-N-acetylmuramyl pentapeptide phosphotransferase/UDP-N-acetylglucosamine-1-phosphate transferase